MEVTLQDLSVGERGGHVGAACFAIAVSAGLHLVLLGWLASVRFAMPAAGAALQPQESERMRVEQVFREPAPVKKPVWRAEQGESVERAPGPDRAATGEVAERDIASRMLTTPDLDVSAFAGESKALRSYLPDGAVSVRSPPEEILQIEKSIVADNVAAIPRRVIPRVERVRTSEPGSYSVSRDAAVEGRSGAGSAPVGMPGVAPVEQKAGLWVTGVRSPPAVVSDGGGAAAALAAVKDAASVKSAMKPIEKLLKARMTLSGPAGDGYRYFKVEIERLGPEVLPVLGRDLLLVQDCSASISEQRLFFCRDGYIRALGLLGPKDRFNVIGFREKSEKCFDSWAAVTPETLERARLYIAGMRSLGNTDIYASMTNLLTEVRTPGRPAIAVVVTDGMASTGLTASSDIIGAFSKVNGGALSVFTMGTVKSANEYLLEFLSYCNRGESLVVASGRWDIPGAIESLVRGLGRPVMCDVGYYFAESSRCEVYPKLTPHLYLDRPLVLLGRMPEGQERVLFQVFGRAGSLVCDMLFDFKLADAGVGGRELKEAWVRQRVYSLVGDYAVKRDPSLLEELRKVATENGLSIPYGGNF